VFLTKTAYSIFYKKVLPIFISVCLLFISPLVDRPTFRDSDIFDWIIRIWIAFSFSYGYIVLEKYKNTLKAPSNSENPNFQKVLIFIRATIVGVITIFIVRWIIINFFTPLVKIDFLIGLIFGLTFFLPLLFPTGD
jgi:hypothetical protein